MESYVYFWCWKTSLYSLHAFLGERAVCIELHLFSLFGFWHEEACHLHPANQDVTLTGTLSRQDRYVHCFFPTLLDLHYPSSLSLIYSLKSVIYIHFNCETRWEVGWIYELAVKIQEDYSLWIFWKTAGKIHFCSMNLLKAGEQWI